MASAHELGITEQEFQDALNLQRIYALIPTLSNKCTRCGKKGITHANKESIDLLCEQCARDKSGSVRIGDTRFRKHEAEKFERKFANTKKNARRRSDSLKPVKPSKRDGKKKSRHKVKRKSSGSSSESSPTATSSSSSPPGSGSSKGSDASSMESRSKRKKKKSGKKKKSSSKAKKDVFEFEPTTSEWECSTIDPQPLVQFGNPVHRVGMLGALEQQQLPLENQRSNFVMPQQSMIANYSQMPQIYPNRIARPNPFDPMAVQQQPLNPFASGARSQHAFLNPSLPNRPMQAGRLSLFPSTRPAYNSTGLLTSSSFTPFQSNASSCPPMAAPFGRSRMGNPISFSAKPQFSIRNPQLPAFQQQQRLQQQQSSLFQPQSALMQQRNSLSPISSAVHQRFPAQQMMQPSPSMLQQPQMSMMTMQQRPQLAQAQQFGTRSGGFGAPYAPQQQQQLLQQQAQQAARQQVQPQAVQQQHQASSADWWS